MVMMMMIVGFIDYEEEYSECNLSQLIDGEEREEDDDDDSTSEVK